MQIVIKLSDKIYKDIKEENSIYGINNGLSAKITGKVVGAIQNGTPIPDNATPCDFCRYNPPSSTDGKPCCMCPATSYQKGGNE